MLTRTTSTVKAPIPMPAFAPVDNVDVMSGLDEDVVSVKNPVIVGLLSSVFAVAAIVASSTMWY
jgi:hypothetical protein